MKISKIIINLLTILPLSSTLCFSIARASMPKASSVENQLKKYTWNDLYEKTVNGQMPSAFYQYLDKMGVKNEFELSNLDESVKKQIVDSYNKQKANALLVISMNDSQ